jgi:hypothetical protein
MSKGEDGAFCVVAELLANGRRWQRYEQGMEQNASGELIVVNICLDLPKYGPTHFWHCNSNAFRYVTTKTYRWQAGSWKKYKSLDNTVELVDAEAPSSTGFSIVISKEQDAAPSPTTVAHSIFLFAQHLRGPADIETTPQELAKRFRDKYKGHLIAFDRKWSHDQSQKKTQGFFVVPAWDAFSFRVQGSTTRKDLHNFYECILESLRVHFYLDFDGSFKEFPQLQQIPKDQLVAHLKRIFADEFRKHYPDCGDLNVIVLDASNDQKYSFHFIGRHSDGLVWRDASCLRAFVSHIRTRVFQDLIGQEKPDEDRTKLIDLSVYDKNKKFRLFQNTKRDQKRWFCLYESENVTFRDTLVGVYDDPIYLTLGAVGSRFIIPVARDSPQEVELLHKVPDLTLFGERRENGIDFYYKPRRDPVVQLFPVAVTLPGPLGWLENDGPLPTEFATEPPPKERVFLSRERLTGVASRSLRFPSSTPRRRRASAPHFALVAADN